MMVIGSRPFYLSFYIYFFSMKSKSYSGSLYKQQFSVSQKLFSYGLVLKNIILFVVLALFAIAIYVFGYTWEGFESGLDYSAYPSATVLDSANQFSLAQTPDSCKKVNGISGVLCQGEKRDAGIDPLANNTSSMTCEYSGITKSGGNVCLTPEQRKLLTTRGGNSVDDSQIA